MVSPGKFYDIIVIGAGVAGLSAALRLQEQVAEEKRPPLAMLILEAEADPGGRARTIWLGDGQRSDSGAHWLHGGKDTPFYGWLRDHYPDVGLHDDGMKHAAEILADGTVVPQGDQRLAEEFSDLYEKWKKAHPESDISLAGLAAQSDSAHAAAYASAMAHNWMAVSDPEHVSADELYGDAYDYAGLQVQGGFERILRRMVADARSRGAIVALGREASRISGDGDALVVSLEDGTECRAARVLVTVSLGVLQSGAIAFAGGLPNAVATYLTNLQMGQTTKIIVPLTHEFFTERNIAPDSYLNFIGAEPPVFCHARPQGHPYATFLNGGEDATRLESMTAGEIFAYLDRTAGIHPDWRGLAAHAAAPPTVTQWGSNMHFRGSYSALLPGAKRRGPMRAGNLFFAGEAFIAHDENGKEASSMLSGAFSSGRMAADLIMTSIRAGD